MQQLSLRDGNNHSSSCALRKMNKLDLQLIGSSPAKTNIQNSVIADESMTKQICTITHFLRNFFVSDRFSTKFLLKNYLITQKNKLWDNCFYLCNSIRVKDIFSLTKVNQVKLVGKQALRSSCELLRQLLKWKQGHGIACKPLELHVSLWN